LLLGVLQHKPSTKRNRYRNRNNRERLSHRFDGDMSNCVGVSRGFGKEAGQDLAA
jgi:hypothetical protein